MSICSMNIFLFFIITFSEFYKFCLFLYGITTFNGLAQVILQK